MSSPRANRRTTNIFPLLLISLSPTDKFSTVLDLSASALRDRPLRYTRPNDDDSTVLTNVHATQTYRAYVYVTCVYVPRGIYRRRLRSPYTSIRVDTVHRLLTKSFVDLSSLSYAMTHTRIPRMSISLDNCIAQ